MFPTSILQLKAGLRTLIPIEQKYIEEEPRVSKQVKQHPTLISYHTAAFFFIYIHHCFAVLSKTNKPWEWHVANHNYCVGKIQQDDWKKNSILFLFPPPFSVLSSIPPSSHPLWVVNRNVKLSALGCISRLAILIVGPLCHCCFALHCHAAQCGGTTKGWIVGAGPNQTCHMSDRLGSAVNAAPCVAQHTRADHTLIRTHTPAPTSLFCQPSIYSRLPLLFRYCSVSWPTLRFFPKCRSLFHLHFTSDS